MARPIELHDDFEVLEGEEAVGRIRLFYHPDGRPKWHWSLYGVAIRGGALEAGGRTDSRDQAVAALEAAWDTVEKR